MAERNPGGTCACPHRFCSSVVHRPSQCCKRPVRGICPDCVNCVELVEPLLGDEVEFVAPFGPLIPTDYYPGPWVELDLPDRTYAKARLIVSVDNGAERGIIACLQVEPLGLPSLEAARSWQLRANVVFSVITPLRVIKPEPFFVHTFTSEPVDSRELHGCRKVLLEEPRLDEILWGGELLLIRAGIQPEVNRVLPRVRKTSGLNREDIPETIQGFSNLIPIAPAVRRARSLGLTVPAEYDRAVPADPPPAGETRGSGGRAAPERSRQPAGPAPAPAAAKRLRSGAAAARPEQPAAADSPEAASLRDRGSGASRE